MIISIKACRDISGSLNCGGRYEYRSLDAMHVRAKLLRMTAYRTSQYLAAPQRSVAIGPERTSPTSSGIAIRAAMMAFGRGGHEAPRVYLYSRRYRCGILAPPPHHHRRDGRHGASADRSQRCRPTVGYLQKLVKAWQIAKAR